MPDRVLVVDRRRLFATGLVRLLAQRPAVLHAQTLLERTNLAAVLRDHWDLVVADGQSVPDVLAHAAPGTRVLVLLEDEDCERAATLLERGVGGVCVPADSAEDVAAAAEQVAAGEMRLPAHLVGPILDALVVQGERAARVEQVLGSLTRREREVLALLGQGLGRVEVARRTGLSPNTVRTHVQHLLQKLSVHSQLEAAACARELLAAQDGRGAAVIDLRTAAGASRPRAGLR